MDTLAARLRSLRRDANLTQEELAKRAGTNQSVIQKIENGRSEHPRCIIELAKALNINPAWLQFGEQFASRKSWS